MVTIIQILGHLLGVQTLVLTLQAPYRVIPWEHNKRWQWAIVSIMGPVAVRPTRAAAQWLCNEFEANLALVNAVATDAEAEQSNA